MTRSNAAWRSWKGDPERCRRHVRSAGRRLRDDLVRQIGLGTVLATALKVLLFDLAAVPGLWRVLLFMGLGGLLLLVSYLVPSLLRGGAQRAEG